MNAELASLTDADVAAHLVWPEVFAAEYGFVHSVVRRLAGPELDADDLTQDVFVIVHRKFSSLRDAESLRPWLYGICRRVVAHQRRKGRLRRALWRLWVGGEDTRDGAPQERRLASSQAERQLYQALERLTDKRREVIVLFALHGMNGNEIAELLGIPVATVWTRLHAARKELQKHLEELDRDPAIGGAS